MVTITPQHRDLCLCITYIEGSGSNLATCWIIINEYSLVETFTDPNGNSDGGRFGVTNSVVIHLVHGDQVYLGLCSSIDSICSGGVATTFSGFLLQAD